MWVCQSITQLVGKGKGFEGKGLEGKGRANNRAIEGLLTQLTLQAGRSGRHLADAYMLRQGKAKP